MIPRKPTTKKLIKSAKKKRKQKKRISHICIFLCNRATQAYWEAVVKKNCSEHRKVHCHCCLQEKYQGLVFFYGLGLGHGRTGVAGKDEIS